MNFKQLLIHLLNIRFSNQLLFKIKIFGHCLLTRRYKLDYSFRFEIRIITLDNKLFDLILQYLVLVSKG